VTKDNCTMQMYTAQITVAPNVLERTSSWHLCHIKSMNMTHPTSISFIF
jgi:hypothetical protein